jgi:hypothetical protein
MSAATYELRDNVAWLGLNRPRKRNAIDSRLLAALHENVKRERVIRIGRWRALEPKLQPLRYRLSKAACAFLTTSACSAVQALRAKNGLSSERASGVTRYSTPGGAPSISRRSRIPLRSSRRRHWVNVFGAIFGTCRFSALNRSDPPAAQIAPRTRMLHRSAIWSSRIRSKSLPSVFMGHGGGYLGVM